LTDKDWPLRKKFCDAIAERFKHLPKILTYYPGSQQRCTASKGCALKFDEFVSHSDQNAVKPIVFFDAPVGVKELHQTEAFAPVLVESAIDSGNNTEKFLEKALKYCNSNDLFGSLSCSVIIDPRTEAQYKQKFNDFVAKLEYGTIAINEWGGSGSFFPGAIWGAYPKHSPEDIQSGMGKVGNVLLYDNVQKTVLKGGFVNPIHFTVPDQYFGKVIERMTYFNNNPTWTRFFGVLSAKYLGY